MKLGRRCQLSVEVNPQKTGQVLTRDTQIADQGTATAGTLVIAGTQTLTIPQDITVEFEISRQFLSSSQEATFRIIQLQEGERNLLQKDPYALTEFRAIQFRAGYKDFPLPLVFNGFVRSATSYRRGQEAITEITAYDGGLAMANGWTAQTVAGGTTLTQVLASLAKSLPRTAGAPIIGNFPGTNLRAKVLFGNTWSTILQESGNLATIDNGQVKILQQNEAVEALIPVLNSESGLLDTPRRTPTKIEFEMLFEPRLTVGQIVQLDSSFNRLLNGTYKVTGFSHRGIISPAFSGECRSSVSLFFGPEELKVVKGNVVQ